MNKQIKNFGFIEPEIVPEDFWLGSGKLGSIVLNEKGDWREWLPIMEKQNQGNETSCCVSFGTLSALEILHKFHFETEPNYSDRFLCKMSDTDNGNTPKKVADTARHSGCVPEKEYPFVIPLDEFFQDIPQKLIDMGIDWLKDFEVGYEYTTKEQLKEALKRSPVGVAVSAWEQNDKGEYVYFGTWNHWCVLVAYDEQDRPIIWDSYDAGLKTLVKDYNFGFPQIYTLNKKKEEKRSWWQRFINWIKSLFV